MSVDPLVARRMLACERDEAFRAWTDPDALVTWFGGGLARTLGAEADLRPGGAYRLTMEAGTQRFALEGVYREVEPPERLVYTWRWEGLEVDAGRESLVTVEFRDTGGATEVVITHDGLEGDESLTFHDGGWNASLAAFAGVVGAELPVLWHLKPSHYNEKARWALDYKGVPHVRHAIRPGRQRTVAEKLWGGKTLPALEIGGRAIGDSTRIIEELERRYPEPALYPADPELRARALELEDFFDEELGPHVRLLVFHALLPDTSLMFATFVPEARDGFKLRMAKAMFPLMRRRVKAAFGIDHESVERAYAKIRAAGDRLRAENGPTGYLCGDSFTVADLTVAALVAPAGCPEQFPYPQAQRGHPRLAPLRDALGEACLLDFALGMYERHRSRSAAVAAVR